MQPATASQAVMATGTVPSPAPASLLAALRAERPRFHHASYDEPAGARDWSISDPVLQWLATELPEGGTTLETGLGYSTVLFAARSARHIALSYTVDEIRLIAAWCAAHGQATAHVQHHAGRSQDILPTLGLPTLGLPTLGLPTLDCVLIDGDHAFPVPYMDFYHTADHLKPGGFLLNDDLHLRSCMVLDRFLEGEAKAGRWRKVTRLKNTSVWQRVAAESMIRQTHKTQPFSREWDPVLRARRVARGLKRRLLGRPGAA
jgi:predicted O-methyltransferase YrrM